MESAYTQNITFGAVEPLSVAFVVATSAIPLRSNAVLMHPAQNKDHGLE